MQTMIRRLLAVTVILLSVAGGSAFGQRRDTIFQVLVTNATSNGTTPNVTNIGQGQHRANLQFSSTPMNQCDISTLNARWEISYDGASFSAAGHPTTGPAFGNIITNNPRVTMKLDGAYPYVRISYVFDTTLCTLTINYSGTLFPSSDDTAVPQNTPVTGLLTAGIDTAASATIVTGTAADLHVCVYSLTLIPDAAVRVTLATPASGVVGGSMLLGNTTPLILPGGPTPHFCTPGRGFSLTLDTAVQVSGFVVYREEYLPTAF